jgi:hypothetical protein
MIYVINGGCKMKSKKSSSSKKKVKKGKQNRRKTSQKRGKNKKRAKKEEQEEEDWTKVLCSIHTECQKLSYLMEQMAEIYSQYDSEG